MLQCRQNANPSLRHLEETPFFFHSLFVLSASKAQTSTYLFRVLFYLSRVRKIMVLKWAMFFPGCALASHIYGARLQVLSQLAFLLRCPQHPHLANVQLPIIPRSHLMERSRPTGIEHRSRVFLLPSAFIPTKLKGERYMLAFFIH